MKITRKITAFILAAILSSSCFTVPMRYISTEPISVSAAVYDEVPEGYTGIYTIDDLYGIRNNLSGKYILMNDIDLSETAPGGDWDSGNGWKPIGDKSSGYFKGTFDGNGHAIKNMYIYGTLDVTENFVGLFGLCGYAVLKRIALIDCDINVTIPAKMNKEYDIGGICAYNESGSIAESYVSGAIKIIINSDSSSYSNYIGGIVAEMPLSSVKNVFNLCEISVDATSSSNSNYIGGITGKMGSLGTYLYNAGNIMCTEKENNSKCYIGNIAGTVTSSANFNSTCYSFYYLKSLSNYTAIGNRTDSYYSDVAGLTIGQMKSQSAFNFDFDNVWTIDPMSEYPYPTLQEVPYVSSGSSPQPTTEPEQNETNPSSDSSLKGDINGDGKVNATDAAIILVYAAMTGAGHQVSIDDLY